MFAQRTILMLVIAGLLALMMSQSVEGTFAGGKGNGKKPPPEPEPEALAGKIYFNNRSTRTTWVMNPDGSNKEEVKSWIRGTPFDVVIDTLGRPVFLVNQFSDPESYDSNDHELYAVTKDEGHEGHEVHPFQLTAFAKMRLKHGARWSPDGNYVAFSFAREDPVPTIPPGPEQWGIAVGRVRDNMGNLMSCPYDCPVFTLNLIGGGALAWSSDGRRLAFHLAGATTCFYSESEDPAPFTSDLMYVVEVVNDGGNVVPIEVKIVDGNVVPMQTELFDMDLQCLNKQNVDWSPNSLDGSCPSRILFVMSPPGETHSKDLYTVCPDGTGLVKVTSVKAKRTNVNPRWSPDGKYMVYVEYNRPKFEFNIFRIKADGSGAVNLTKDTKGGASNVGWRIPIPSGP